MKRADNTLDSLSLSYDISQIGNPEEICFLDIETTGFTARSSYLYLIGCVYFKSENWHTVQWLAETYEQEAEILSAFFEFVKPYRYLVHFNGNQFDLPFLTQKSAQLGLSYSFDGMEGVDLYKRIAPLKYFLKLNNCKQKTIEAFLGIERQDVFSGGELIGVYHDYVKNPSEFSRNSLLLHNEDDLKGMLQILPILAYYDMLQSDIRAKKVQANSYRDVNGDQRKELLIQVGFSTALPVPVSASANGCYFHGEGDSGFLRVPLFEEELKYFYANYQEYYYLPEEDLALHKSIATFVEKEHRTQATAATCYTRKQSSYLPQWDDLFDPIFRRDYRSKEIFFELTDEMKRNRTAFNRYASHVLSMIASTY